MLRSILFISVCYMLMGCGQGFRAINHGQVDPEFQPYVDLFMEYANLPVIHVDMYFNPQSGNVIGVCYKRGNDRKVEIDVEWWDKAGELDREILIFHELGHCVLEKPHTNFDLEDGCGGSVMNEYHIGAYCYDKHYDHYIEELF